MTDSMGEAEKYDISCSLVGAGLSVESRVGSVKPRHER